MENDGQESHQKSESGFVAAGHLALDLVGFIPGVGEIADVTNAAWYATDEQYLDAGLSLISTIPIVGDVIGKGGKATKAIGPKASKKIIQAIKSLDVPHFLRKFKSDPRIGKYIDKISVALEKWQAELVEQGAKSKVRGGVTGCPHQFAQTTNGLVLKPNPEKTTTILGKFDADMKRIINEELKAPKSLDFGPKKGGFNTLNIPDKAYKNPDQFWHEYNKPFLDNAIKRGDTIVIATDPKKIANLVNSDGTLSGFGREIVHLKKNGYVYDAATKSMVKK